MSAEIPYWWCITTQIWIVLLLLLIWWLKQIFSPSEAPFRLGEWWFISMEFLHLCHRRHFAEEPVVVSQNVGCNLRLTTTGFTTKTASEKWESQNVDCHIRLTIGVEKYEITACIKNKRGAMASGGLYWLNLENCTLFFFFHSVHQLLLVKYYTGVCWMQNPAASLYLGYYHPKPLWLFTFLSHK